MGRRLPRPSPATTLAVLALVVATGGTSYAAAKIDTQDIARDAVTSGKIQDGTIKRRDIQDGTLNANKFVEGTIPDGVRWVLVDADGEIEAQSGGFSVTAAYPAEPAAANGNVYIDAGEDLTDNGIVASVALQNTVDQNDDGVMNGRAEGADANPEFSGEIGVSKCDITGTTSTNCAPAGTNNPEHFVISPRLSDGSPTSDDNRKRFYVMITG